MFAPSFASAVVTRATISSSETARRATPRRAAASAARPSTSGSGSGMRLPGSYRYQPAPVFWP